MRILVLTLLLAIGFATTASARLGETESAVLSRYGQPHFKTKRPWGEDQGFTMNGFTITVTFLNGISNGELFSIPGRVISDEQVKGLLEANSEGFLWDEVAKADLEPPAKRMWKKPNGSTAVLTMSAMEFKSANLLKAQTEAANAKPEAPSTKGF